MYLYSLFHATIDPLKSLPPPRSCYYLRFSGFVSVSIYEHSSYIIYFLRTINNQYPRSVSNKWFLIEAQFVTKISFYILQIALQYLETLYIFEKQKPLY